MPYLNVSLPSTILWCIVCQRYTLHYLIGKQAHCSHCKRTQPRPAYTEWRLPRETTAHTKNL